MIALLARCEWRARWRSHALFAGVIALSVAVVVGTLTGASRTDSAFKRLRAATNASDLEIFVSPADFDAVESIDGVVEAEPAVSLFLRPAGTEYVPGFQLLVTAPLDPARSSIDTPVVRKGRLVDPARAGEVAVSESIAEALGLEPGDVITLESMTDGWVDASFPGSEPGPPDGPRVDAEVVGVVRSPADFSRLQALIYLSPAFAERYGDQMRTDTFVRARLTPEAQRQVQTREFGVLFETGALDFQPSVFGDDASTEDGLGTIAGALRMVAAAAALAGAVVIGLMALRLTRLALASGSTLRAIGWTRRDQVQAATILLGPPLVTGTVIGAVVGALSSRLALRGLARAADPAPDALRVDVPMTALVLLAAIVVGTVATVLAAWSVTSRRGPAVDRVAPMPSLRRPLQAMVGMRDALFGASDRGGRASRAAIGVGAAGVAIAVAAIVVSSSIGRLQTDPTLNGRGLGRSIDGGDSIDAFDEAMTRLEGDERVDVLAAVHTLFDIVVDGEQSPGTVAFDIRRGDIGASVISGRLPTGAGEVALGPATLESLGKRVGDRVTLTAEEAEGEFKIVGSMVFPEGEFTYDEGVAIAAVSADRLTPGYLREGGFGLHQVVFDWADGVDAADADRALAAEGFQVFTGTKALLPAPVSNLGEVVALPRFLAAFVGLLALVTLAHAAAVAVRSHATKLGTLRALGFTGRGAAGVVVVHVFVLAVGALVLGVPLGLAAGRVVWRVIAEAAHVVVRPDWSAGEIGLVVGVAVVAAVALAAVAVVRVVRLRPAEFLRAE